MGTFQSDSITRFLLLGDGWYRDHPIRSYTSKVATRDTFCLTAFLPAASAACNGDLGEVEVGLGLAAIDVKNAATDCNSNGTAFTACTDDVEKISAQLAKVTTHATSAATDCSPSAGTECAFDLGNLTEALGKATTSFTHAATSCANARGKVLCDAFIAAGTLSVLGAISDNTNAINSCEG